MGLVSLVAFAHIAWPYVVLDFVCKHTVLKSLFEIMFENQEFTTTGKYLNYMIWIDELKRELCVWVKAAF